MTHWRKNWTEAEIAFVKTNHEEKSCDELADDLGNKTVWQIEYLLRALRLRKPKDCRRLRPGDQIGRLEIIGERFLAKSGKQKHYRIPCRCLHCKRESKPIVSQLQRRNGGCVCMTRENNRQRTLHGMTKTRLYHIWSTMKARCYRPGVEAWPDYGGRGITICKEWQDSFEAFRDWALANGYEDNLEIDRIDVNGGYSPENCRFTDRITQANNKRNNHVEELEGERKTLAQWIKDPRCEVSYHTLKRRLNHAGWTFERALTTPPTPPKRMVSAFGESKPLIEWVRDSRCRADYKTVHQRISRLGWDPERSITTPQQKNL